MTFLVVMLVIINTLLLVALLVATGGKFSRLRDQLIGRLTRFIIKRQINKERKKKTPPKELPREAQAHKEEPKPFVFAKETEMNTQDFKTRVSTHAASTKATVASSAALAVMKANTNVNKLNQRFSKYASSK